MTLRNTNKAIIRLFLFIAMALLGTSLMATPVSTWNHRSNPALLGTSNRSVFETGFSAYPGISNSYFTTHSFADPTLLIDFDDIVNTLGDGGFRLGATLRAGAHSTIHLLGVGAGMYADTDTVFRLTVPKELFELVAQGNELNQVYSATGDILLQSFAEYGAYLGMRYKSSYHLGLKIGKYVPLAYARDSEALYTFEAKDDGTIHAGVEVGAKLFSAFDLENMDAIEPDAILDALTGPDGGIKIDLGLVHNPDRNRPKWGVSLVNIPISPAKNLYGWNFTVSADATLENILDFGVNEALEDGEEAESEDPYTITEPDPQFEAIAGSEDIYMPFRFGGFYRFDMLPLVDVIPHAELIFGTPFRFSGGVSLEGSVWPLSWLSAGISYDEINWKSSMGLRINLRVLEIETQLSLSSPELLGMFSSNGISMNVVASVGF